MLEAGTSKNFSLPYEVPVQLFLSVRFGGLNDIHGVLQPSLLFLKLCHHPKQTPVPRRHPVTSAALPPGRVPLGASSE